MIAEKKIEELKTLIKSSLLPLISNRKCVLLDLPYYSNIGDTLIWEGTKCFFRTNNIKCNYYASKDTFDFRDIDEDTIIVLQGGGNFGDIWIQHQIFRKKIIEKYTNNKIIILPHSVQYNDCDLIKEDAELFSMHKNLIICARDEYSYNLLKEKFSNNILLVPDMAFYIDVEKLNDLKIRVQKESLFLKRCDKEYKSEETHQSIIPNNSDVLDWPTMNYPMVKQRIFDKLFIYKKIVGLDIINKYANLIYRPFLIKEGVEFISKYENIYTTRLHGAILSILLGKNVIFFDNSYGKNSRFYDTWLYDIESIKFIK